MAIQPTGDRETEIHMSLPEIVCLGNTGRVFGAPLRNNPTYIPYLFLFCAERRARMIGKLVGDNCLLTYQKETDMDAIQRSEVNNQTNNGANEKWNPDAKGATRDLVTEETAPSGTGMAHKDAPSSSQGQFASTGGQQGTTDSHQQQMEMHSDAWGQLEQPVGNRAYESGASTGVNVAHVHGHTGTSHNPYPTASAQAGGQGDAPARDAGNVPETVSGSVPNRVPGMTDEEVPGSEAGMPSVQYGDIYGHRQSANSQQGENHTGGPNAGSSKIQESTDRNGSQTGEARRDPPVK